MLRSFLIFAFLLLTAFPSYAASISAINLDATTLATSSSTNTFTNKRTQPRVYSTASNTSLTPEIATYDVFVETALAGAITINNHSTSTPADGEKMIIRLLDNGTARAISWGTEYAARGVPLPSTTIVSKYLTLGFIWNANASTWDLIAMAQEQ